MKRRWTLEEIDHLITYRYKGSKELARELKRTEGSVKTMASRIGVRLSCYMEVDYLGICSVCGDAKALIKGEQCCMDCYAQVAIERAAQRETEQRKDIKATKKRINNRLRQRAFRKRRKEEM